MAVTVAQMARLPARVRRRDGSEIHFESERILSAIRRAGQATGEFAEDEAAVAELPRWSRF